MPERHHSNSSRFFVLLVVPAFFFSAMTYWLVSAHFNHELDNHTRAYGVSLSSQLAIQFTQHLVDEDILSLNVLANQAAKEDAVDSIAIYGESNELLTQAGKTQRGSRVFTKEITFQDSMVGFVRIAVAPQPTGSQAIWVVVMALLVYLAGIWRFAKTIRDWVSSVPATGPDSELSLDEKNVELAVTEEASTEAPVDSELVEESILVVRIRPARYMEQYFDSFYQAAEAYSGIVEQTTTEELVIHFEDRFALYKAVCAGVLIKELAAKTSRKIRFGGSIDLLDADPERQRKSASYLASLAEGDLLLMTGAKELAEHIVVQSFHHSLIDSRNIQRVTGLKDSSEITRHLESLA